MTDESVSRGREFAEAILRSHMPGVTALEWHRDAGVEGSDILSFVIENEKRSVRFPRAAIDNNVFTEISASIHAQMGEAG